jgi:hypothetical protein
MAVVIDRTNFHMVSYPVVEITRGFSVMHFTCGGLEKPKFVFTGRTGGALGRF